MKKILLGALVLASMCVKAEILLWQITTSSLPTKWASETQPDFVEARLMATGSDSPLQYAGVDIGPSDPIMEVQSFDMSVLPSGGTAQSFYVELYSFDSSGTATLEAYSGAIEYNRLTEFMNSSLMATDLMAWNGGKFKAAPEPTSGLLMLLGLAGLALRRKR